MRTLVTFPGKLFNDQSLLHHQSTGLKESVHFLSVAISREHHVRQLALEDPMAQVKDTARIETAHQATKKLFGTPVTLCRSCLLSVTAKKLISSPLKESLSNSRSPNSNQYHHRDWVDKNDVHWIQYKPTAETIVVPISRKDIFSVLNITITEEGNLAIPTFVKGSKRADFLRRNCEKETPYHVFQKHLRDTIYTL